MVKKAKKRTKAQRAALSAKMKSIWAAKKSGQTLKSKIAQGPWATPRSLKEAAKAFRSAAGASETPTPTGFVLDVAGYHALAEELHAAFEQSAHGKGKERHANGRPFDRQPLLELTRLYGPGFSAGQAAKKAQEALGMAQRGEIDKAVHEVHGAIVYLAAVAHFLRTSGR